MFATPAEAEYAFYDALEQADLTRLMQVWADDEEIVCIHSSGLRIIGHSAVRESWQQILANGPLLVRPLQPLVMKNMMCAVHILVEHAAVRTSVSTRFSNFYTTNIYHNGPRGWRMVLHHTSPAPAEAGLLDLHDVPDMLH
jgi:ketosteroid isomerase-like protein